MSSYSPLWSLIVDSSIWEEPDFVRIVFITMLALKDADHVVRRDAYKLAKSAHKSEQEVLEALKVLSSPDKRRLEPQEFDGRRIKKVADGWLILNGQKYRDMMRTLAIRESKRHWAKNNRDTTKALKQQLAPAPVTPHNPDIPY